MATQSYAQTQSPVCGDPGVSEQERLLFVPEIVAFGGGERVYLSLAKFLHQQSIPHRIVSYYQDIDLQAYADWPLQIDILSPDRNPVKKAWALKQYIQTRQRVNTVPPLLIGLQSALHAATFNLRGYSVFILDAPSMMTKTVKTSSPLRSHVSKLRDAGSDRLTSKSLHQANSVMITTNLMADEIEALYGVLPQVSRLGVAGNPAMYQYQQINAPHSLRLLSVCRLEGSKRIDWILRSLATLENQQPSLSQRANWKLDVVGAGSQREVLELMVRHLGLEHRVIFHGQVSDERLEQIYHEANLFLMPAIQGYGLPALEALTRKVPVLMHRQSGVSEILENTPWVEIIAGGEESLIQGMQVMIQRLLTNSLATCSLPSFPSETDWAAEVCRVCQWM